MNRDALETIRASMRAIVTRLILLTDLLTTDLDSHGRGWEPLTAYYPIASSNRRPWMAPDVPDLATDQKVGGSSPSERATSAVQGPSS